MSSKRILTIISFTLLAITLFIVIVCASLPLYFNNKIKNELQTQVSEITENEYKLKIDKIRINILNQSIYISGFNLIPSKTIKPEIIKYELSAKKIKLEDLHIWSLILHKDLIVDKMVVVKPVGIIYRNSASKENKIDSSKNATIYSVLKKSIHSLCIGLIKVRNADISIYNSLNDKRPAISSNKSELHILKFKINEESEKQKRFFLADTCLFVINKFIFKGAKNLNTLSISKITASYNDSTLQIDSLKLTPNFSKQEYAKKAGKQTDRIVISLTRAAFRQTDIKSLIENNKLIANSLKVTNFNLEAYRDKNDPPVIKIAPSLQQKLKTIPLLTNIDVIQLYNAQVVYEEVAKGADKAGSISFNNLNGTVIGFTNNAVYFGKNTLDVKASCMFMNAGELQAHFSFPLNTEQMVFDCSGRLGEMNLNVIYKILIPNAHLNIKDGKIDSAILSFHADNEAALGTIKVAYHNFKVELLKNNNERGLYERTLSLLLRILFIKNENPKRNKELRTEKINYKRDPNRFIFSYAWHSILSGIKPTIGLPRKIKNKKPNV